MPQVPQITLKMLKGPKNKEFSIFLDLKFSKNNINPQALVAQKTADEVVFRHFQGEGVEFFLIGPH